MGNFQAKQETPLTHREKKRMEMEQAKNSYIDQRLASLDDVANKTNEASPTDHEVEEARNTKSKANQSKLQKIPSVLTELEIQVMSIKIEDHSYPFENLVFEGGGTKGVAFCGAIKVLEEHGLSNQIRRYAGASVGALTAAILAVGYNSQEIQEILSQDLSEIFLDARYGWLSFLPNLLRGYGWHPGIRFYSWFGEVLAKKTNDPDISFIELYRKTGKELCVVVTNLNHMTEEYCHPKTTPDMPIRQAVRMSISLPGMFQAMNYTVNGETNTYIDGGVLCNYPIHCYDGWWLSMRQEDTFLEKLQPLDDLPRLLDRKNRFCRHPYSNKTLGLMLYNDSEQDVFKFMLEKRIGTHLGHMPNTKLANATMKQKDIQETAKREHRRVTMAVDQFLKVLKKNKLDNNDTIDKTELENTLADDEFSKENFDRLFGENCTVQEIFELLDLDSNGEIHFSELMHFIQSTGVYLQQRFLGYQRREIDGIFSFFAAVQTALSAYTERVFVDNDDLDRTVGINTGYLGLVDFKMEKEDIDFVVDQGYRSTEAFLKYYAAKENMEQNEQTANI